MKLARRFALVAVIVAVASGCSVLFDTGSGKKPTRTDSSAGMGTPVLEKTAAGVEVTWEVPSDSVDGFVIRYGDDRANLTKEATIFRSELREERDAQYGPVYRYVLVDIPSSGQVYVSVAAFKGDTISDFSEPTAERR